MAKQNSEPKFRVVRFAISNENYVKLERVAKAMKVSKSAVVSNLLLNTPDALIIRRQNLGENTDGTDS